MLDRVVWRPVGKYRAVGLHMLLAKFIVVKQAKEENKPTYCDVKLDTIHIVTSSWTLYIL
jgi:hypothetical protein